MKVEEQTESAPRQTGSPRQESLIRQAFIRRPRALLVSAVVIILALFFGIRYYLHARSHESTDDAFVEGQVIQISPKIAGHIVKVYVKDNQPVKQGDLLLELDARDFQARLEQAQAALKAAETRERAAHANIGLTQATSQGGLQQATSGVTAASSGIETARARVNAARERAQQARAAITTAQANAQQAQAQISAAEAEANRTTADVQRYQQLYEKDEISRQQLDNALSAARVAAAQVAAARDRAAAAQAQINEAHAAVATAEANIREAESQVTAAQAQVGTARGRLTEAASAPQKVTVSEAQAGTASADVQQARAAVEQAELQLSYTKIYAPVEGRITRKAVEVGSFVQVGQPFMAVVSGELWVVANFKETQLDDIRPGQPVAIKVDAFPGKIFKAHVDSIQRGTGSRFSMLPPENATGNYVKVVQRVPVKIVFDEKPDANYPLGPGMSVEPEVAIK